MEESDYANPDLGKIVTQWSLVRRAHEASLVTGSAADARRALVMRYAPAIRRFVQIVVRDPQLADELSQDAMVRLLKGDFSGANPARGRFRDLLKTAVRNMARNHWARENRRASADFDMELLEGDSDDVSQRLDEEWASQWKASLMSLVWDKLKAWEESQPGSIAWTVLRLRSDHPGDSSTQLAERLSEATGRTFRADTTRQQLRRARVRFVELLVAEIADGLPEATPDAVREELVSLGLYASVRDVLPEHWR
jgi:RNA polymerase sigma factor (sigma-70 family)